MIAPTENWRYSSVSVGARNPEFDGAPDADAIRDVDTAPPTRGLTTVSFAVGNRRPVVGRRQAGRHRRLEVVAVVVVPVIDARAQREHQLSIGVKMSCTNAPRLCCVPPETRCTDSVAACVTAGDRTVGHRPATYAVLLAVAVDPSPVEAGAERRCALPSAFDHCAMPPTPLVGTC